MLARCIVSQNQLGSHPTLFDGQCVNSSNWGITQNCLRNIIEANHRKVAWYVHTTALGFLYYLNGLHDRHREHTWDPALDAVAAAPKHHKVLFENENLRVLEVTLEPEDEEPVHHHSWPSVFVLDQIASCQRGRSSVAER
jgi:hypothetical protein